MTQNRIPGVVGLPAVIVVFVAVAILTPQHLLSAVSRLMTPAQTVEVQYSQVMPSNEQTCLVILTNEKTCVVRKTGDPVGERDSYNLIAAQIDRQTLERNNLPQKLD